MAKNKLFKNADIFDFEDSELMDPDMLDSDMAAGIMTNMIEISNNQTKMTLELTKLVLDNIANKNLSEEDIYAVFTRSANVILNNSKLKEIFEEFDMR